MAAPTPLPLPLAGMCAKDYVHIFAMVSTFFLITYIRSVSYHVNTVNALTFGLASLFALSPRSRDLWDAYVRPMAGESIRVGIIALMPGMVHAAWLTVPPAWAGLFMGICVSLALSVGIGFARHRVLRSHSGQ